MAAKKSTKPFEPVTARVDSNALEQDILSYWDSENIFAKTLEQNKEGTLFTFYDGPPYATGLPHYGHVLQSSIKDTVLRYKTMQGYYVPRRVGWDCHGLPVETLVEKELGFKTKKDIEKFGVAEFNQKCREVVFRYIDEFTRVLKRLGRWADYEHAYATLNLDYMESEWWVFKQLWDEGLVYKAFRTTPYCIRCATPLSNFEVTSNYQDTTDTALYVLLKVNGEDNLYLTVWTTTPWTLPANVAVAINPDLAYVTVEHEGKQLVMTSEAAARVLPDADVTHTWKVADLLEKTYEPLYEFVAADGAFRVVPSEHVARGEGTGLVHLAPGFGEEDAELGKVHGLTAPRPVDAHGQYTSEVTPWAGQTVFAANPKIVQDLTERGLVLKEEKHTHSYPFCWRCDTPLIYYALDTWFVKISDLKDRMLAINEHIHWTPEHVKAGRFAKGIESAPDWAVSRNRYWSVPLPIWECSSCHTRVCLGSIEELEKLSGATQIAELHRPEVDAYTWSCEKCQGAMQRVPEVLDVWFDSGAMPYSQWHYPFENKEFVEQGFPADFIAESIEMTRAWFYVLHVLATALTGTERGLGLDQPAFKNAIASGIIFAEDGKKLSKKLKNYPEIEPTLEKYGADVLRFYLLSSTSLGEPYLFSEKELQQFQRKTYLTLWNVYSFFVQYAHTHGWTALDAGEKSKHLLDRWVMARLRQVEQQVISASDDYAIDQAARAFIPFIDDVSNWYVRRSRSRFQKSGDETDQIAAFSTLYTILVQTSVLLAPFMPFVAEAMYRNLTGKDSVHLQRYATPEDLTTEQEELLAAMQVARQIVSLGLSLRAGNKLKVRQPLTELAVMGTSLSAELAQIICDEVNVKQVTVVDTLPTGTQYVEAAEGEHLKVALNIELSVELAREGIARDIIRHGQMLRREAGYALDDHVILSVETDDSELKKVLEEHHAMIAETLKADDITSEKSAADATVEIKLNGVTVTLGVKKSEP